MVVASVSEAGLALALPTGGAGTPPGALPLPKTTINSSLSNTRRQVVSTIRGAHPLAVETTWLQRKFRHLPLPQSFQQTWSIVSKKSFSRRGSLT